MIKHHHIAIAATVVLHQVYGYVWYSPILFLSPWVHGLGKDVDQLNRSNVIPLLVSVGASVATCYVISWLVQLLNIRTFKQGAGFGSLLWLGIAAPAIAVHYAFTGLSWTVTLIDALHALVGLAFTCGLLALWRTGSSHRDESR